MKELFSHPAFAGIAPIIISKIGEAIDIYMDTSREEALLLKEKRLLVQEKRKIAAKAAAKRTIDIDDI